MIDTETKSRSTLASGLLSLVVMPLALGIADSPHILGWYSGTGFPEPAPAVEGGVYRHRYSFEADGAFTRTRGRY